MKRGALIGYGFIGEQGHARGYTQSKDLGIDAVVDTHPIRREKAAQALPGAAIFDSAESFFESELSKRLAFVDICTPPSTHAPLARAALERGLHVLCEKPITTRAADADELVALARKSGRVFYPSHNYTHAPVLKRVQGLLDEGALGDIHMATLSTFRSTHARGVPEWRPDWRREPEISGGGILMDHGSHTFYVAFAWMGAYPTKVSARMLRSAHAPGGSATDDDVACELTFPSGIVRCHLTWRAGNRKVIYTIHGSGGGLRVEDDKLELSLRFGTPGSYRWESKEESVASHWMSASHEAWFTSVFGDFARAMRERDLVPETARDAIACMRVIEACYRSASEEGRAIAVDCSA